EAFKDYTSFLNLVHEKLPKTRVIVNPVKVAESRLKQIPDVKKLNGLLEGWAKENSWVRWVDSTGYLIDENGKPKAEYYRKDKLHLNDAGYAKWNAIIEPVLKEEWERASASVGSGQ
ncbi:MAG: GDSL-type esterase/lipase family protein, partial [Verrucomicrobium sp.]